MALLDSRTGAAHQERGAAHRVLLCTGLHKSFGSVNVVDGVSFGIASGETYGLLGPNGAGKTTIISMVVGVLAADSGSALVDGLRVGPDALDVKARIGYVPQDVALYPDLTARENLRFFASLYRIGRRQARRRMAEVLDVVGLTDRADERVQTFSGGMKRRLNIGVGLIHQPRLLILDEPTVGVDPQSRNAILGSIEQLSSAGMAVLYTTHYMEEAERLCDRVGILDDGRLIAEGTPHELTAGLGQAQHIRMSLEGALPRVLSALADLPVASQVTHSDDTLDIVVTDAETALPVVIETVTSSGSAIRSVAVEEPDLETVFLTLTGKTLRD